MTFLLFKRFIHEPVNLYSFLQTLTFTLLVDFLVLSILLIKFELL
jgi:hypothetical protein